MHSAGYNPPYVRDCGLRGLAAEVGSLQHILIAGLRQTRVRSAEMRKLAYLMIDRVVKSGKPFDANFAIKGTAVQTGI